MSKVIIEGDSELLILKELAEPHVARGWSDWVVKRSKTHDHLILLYPVCDPAFGYEFTRNFVLNVDRHILDGLVRHVIEKYQRT